MLLPAKRALQEARGVAVLAAPVPLEYGDARTTGCGCRCRAPTRPTNSIPIRRASGLTSIDALPGRVLDVAQTRSSLQPSEPLAGGCDADPVRVAYATSPSPPWRARGRRDPPECLKGSKSRARPPSRLSGRGAARSGRRARRPTPRAGHSVQEPARARARTCTSSNGGWVRLSEIKSQSSRVDPQRAALSGRLRYRPISLRRRGEDRVLELAGRQLRGHLRLRRSGRVPDDADEDEPVRVALARRSAVGARVVARVANERELVSECPRIGSKAAHDPI